MVLVLNIDNIIIRLGVYNDAKLHAQASFGTRADATADEYAAQLLQMLSLCGVAVADISGSILSSVVPALTAVVARGVAFSIGRPPMILGPGIKSGLNILTENPAELGTDIVACSVAALARCKPPIILADVGTAIVVSALDKNGGYRGCAIYPGIRLAYRALSEVAAQLPDISIGGVTRAVGKNSVESMHAGLIYGTAAMLDGLIDKISEEVGHASVVITGVYAKDILAFCRHDMTHDENLLLDGLYQIYMKNLQNKRSGKV